MEWERLASGSERARRYLAREGTENAETRTFVLRIASAFRRISLARPGTGNGICRSLARSAGASWVRFATSGNLREIMSALRDSSELLIPFSTGSRPWQHDYAGPSGLWRQHSKRNHNRQTNSPIRQPAGNPQLPAFSVPRKLTHSSESPPQTGQSTRREYRPCPRGADARQGNNGSPGKAHRSLTTEHQPRREPKSSSRRLPLPICMMRRSAPREKPGWLLTLVTEPRIPGESAQPAALATLDNRTALPPWEPRKEGGLHRNSWRELRLELAESPVNELREESPGSFASPNGLKNRYSISCGPRNWITQTGELGITDSGYPEFHCGRTRGESHPSGEELIFMIQA